MINLIIGNNCESEKKAYEELKGKSVFTIGDGSAIMFYGKKKISSRNILFIKNLDNECLFEEIVSNLEELKESKIETLAITYRDDIIEAYEDDQDVNIIDLRGE